MAPRRNSLQRLVGHKIAVTSSDIRAHWRLAPPMPAVLVQPIPVTSGASNIVDLRRYRLRTSERVHSLAGGLMNSVRSILMSAALATASCAYAQTDSAPQRVWLAAGASDVPGVTEPGRTTKPTIPSEPGAGAPATVPKTPADAKAPVKAAPANSPDAVPPEKTDTSHGRIDESTGPTSGDRARPPDDTTGMPKDPAKPDARPGISTPPESIR